MKHITLLLIVTVMALMTGCTRMHNSSIRINVPSPYDSSNTTATQAINKYEGAQLQQVLHQLEQDANRQALADFEFVLKAMDEWAGHNGFCRIAPEQYPLMRLHRISSAGQHHEKVAYYDEHRPADRQWPIQLMIWLDPDEDKLGINVDMVEGYHMKPSKELKRIHASLQSLMARRFGDRVKAGLY